jgi:hypothetical protein
MPVGYLPKANSEAGWDGITQGSGVMTTVSVGGLTQVVKINADNVKKTEDDTNENIVYDGIVVAGDSCGAYRVVCPKEGENADSCGLYRKMMCSHHENRRFLESRAAGARGLTEADGLDEIYANPEEAVSDPSEALCFASPSATVKSLCSELGNVGLSQDITCDDAGNTFTVGEVLEAGSTAAEQDAALDVVLARCGVEEGFFESRRALRAKSDFEQKIYGRKMLVNYGWCSMNINFILDPGNNAKDSADYCKGHRCKQSAGIGCDTPLSKCCVQHDKCLQAVPKNRCGKASPCNGASCDSFLHLCAGRTNCCRFGIGSMCFNIKLLCWAAKSAVRLVMGDMVPNGHWLRERESCNYRKVAGL